ncbi:AAA-domain-containing protein [Cantharellus anzutake]|uniref:AAA-domain-containing protein n=1 Tax=Cantharellus anzutake TaxID=1750568 RepID=UPI001907E1E1|nr:AAA-domain-containing protein [Cantharellus anzutake]KAF8338713.1 AAA-domain-containing protein [Cantharellus anzutake]
MASFFRSSNSSSPSPYTRINSDSNQSSRGPRPPPPPPPQRGNETFLEKITHRSRPQSANMTVANAPNNELGLTNCLIASPTDFLQHGQQVRVNRRFPVTVRHDTTPSMVAGHIEPGSLGVSMFHRQWIGLSPGDVIQIETIDLGDEWLGSLDLEASIMLILLVGFNKKNAQATEVFDSEDMSRVLIKNYSNQVFSPGQIVVFEYHGQTLRATVTGISLFDLGKGGNPLGPMGLLMEKTDITFIKASDSSIKIKGSSKKAPPNAILAPNFKFEDMGIGGLDAEFASIFRRAFASRVFPPGLVEKLGIQHVKGLLLYGPPGTGKTLMARQIGKMLNAREPKIVNGPEILDKFVGKSEENIRKLFADAEAEYKSKGDESGLHIIIFDELDAICRQRGTGSAGGTGVGDTVVNQLLSKMDGVDQLNNILVIGMTNRKDMIDEALLRPGRLEVHMEISLPDEHGRLQILTIHTAKMRNNGIMDRDVGLPELASVTKNFSGAEINGLVKSAASFAFNRHVKVGTMAGISDDVENLRVNRDDFMHALEEVRPLFGVSEEELEAVVQNGIIHYETNVDTLLRDGQLFVEQVKTSTRTPLVSVLLHGPPGSGKTALAATIAQSSQFPFIKLISPESMVGFSEGQKIAAISKVFTDSYKSPISVIVVDNLERLLDWVPIGPRFSNGVLQALMVLMGKRPPKGRRLLVLTTTSLRPMLTEMQMNDIFDAEIRVPPITSLRALDRVLDEVKLFPSRTERGRALALLEQAGFGHEGRLNVGIKKLLSVIEMARQDPNDIAEKLCSALIGLL